MIDVELPDGESPALVRSFAACLASVTETPVADLPQPRADVSGALAHWRSWLAGRGAGLVAIASPATFAWPGYWLGLVGERTPGPAPDGALAVLLFGTPSAVVLSPQDGSLLGSAAADLPIREGFVVSGLDPAALGQAVAPARLRGRVETVAIAKLAAGPMRSVQRAQALAGRGLRGDRYAAKAGTFTPADDALRGYDLTLVDADVLDRLTLASGSALRHADARRNVVTRGVDLNTLVGRRFRVGDVECLGQRLCEPCAHLERLTVAGVVRGLIHRGGLRADVLTDGIIAVGDVIETVD